MALKVVYKNSAMEKGTEVDVAGLGMLKVGEEKTLTAEDENSFFSVHGDTVKNVLKSDELFDVSGSSELRPSELPKLDTEGGR